VTKLLETIKVEKGVPLHIEYHQERLERSMHALHYRSRYDLVSLLSPPNNGTYRCRVIYDDHDISIEYLPYILRPIRSLKAIHADTIEYGLKYLNRDALNVLFEQKESCDDIAIIKNGCLTDTSIANIALFDGQQWCTPKQPLLHGTTRQRLLQSKKIIEKEIPYESISSYTRCGVFNAMTDFIEVENGIIL
jgi:4-amino-4-deoxychorismate lyase